MMPRLLLTVPVDDPMRFGDSFIVCQVQVRCEGVIIEPTNNVLEIKAS